MGFTICDLKQQSRFTKCRCYYSTLWRRNDREKYYCCIWIWSKKDTLGSLTFKRLHCKCQFYYFIHFLLLLSKYLLHLSAIQNRSVLVFVTLGVLICCKWVKTNIVCGKNVIKIPINDYSEIRWCFHGENEKKKEQLVAKWPVRLILFRYIYLFLYVNMTNLTLNVYLNVSKTNYQVFGWPVFFIIFIINK